MQKLNLQSNETDAEIGFGKGHQLDWARFRNNLRIFQPDFQQDFLQIDVHVRQRFSQRFLRWTTANVPLTQTCDSLIALTSEKGLTFVTIVQ